MSRAGESTRSDVARRFADCGVLGLQRGWNAVAEEGRERDPW